MRGGAPSTQEGDEAGQQSDCTAYYVQGARTSSERRKARSSFACSKASRKEKAEKRTGLVRGEQSASNTIPLCRGVCRVPLLPEQAHGGVGTGKVTSEARGVRGTTQDAEPERRDPVLAEEPAGHPLGVGDGPHRSCLFRTFLRGVYWTRQQFFLPYCAPERFLLKFHLMKPNKDCCN